MEGTVALFPEATWGSEREATEARLVFPLPAPWVLQCRVSSVCYGVCMVMCTSVALAVSSMRVYAIMGVFLGGMWMSIQGKHE